MSTPNYASAHTTGDHVLTRERLAQGVPLQWLRANPPSGVRVHSDDELNASLDEALRDHDAADDLHVFGYGSLMWNPAIDAASASVAHVHGWHRRFSLRTVFGRGTVQEPGAMLALDRGGSCRGLLFRIEAAKVRNEARLLWRARCSRAPMRRAGSRPAATVQRCGR
jgi:cation transport protein ChaC